MTTPVADLLGHAQAITTAAGTGDFLTALTQLHRLRAAVDLLEPELIAAARAAGASWQAIAPALGVVSRQAAERRYQRLVPATAAQTGSTREQRVRQLRDRRAGTRAVNDWANDNTADLRRLAAQITILEDLDPAATDDITRLNHALADRDGTTLPTLLAQARQHLHAHPALSRQIDAVVANTAHIRQQTQKRRDTQASGTT